MTINGILVALIAQLKTNLNPSIGAMVINKNQVYEGVRENVITFPCIIVELGRNHVDDYSYPYEKISQYFKVGVFVQQYNKDHQLSNDPISGALGLSSLIDAVKLAITSNPTLGLNDVYDTLCPDTDPSNINYPIRNFTMTVQVKYRQNRLTRV